MQLETINQAYYFIDTQGYSIKGFASKSTNFMGIPNTYGVNEFNTFRLSFKRSKIGTHRHKYSHMKTNNNIHNFTGPYMPCC